jgi:hypothetical protein
MSRLLRKDFVNLVGVEHDVFALERVLERTHPSIEHATVLQCHDDIALAAGDEFIVTHRPHSTRARPSQGERAPEALDKRMRAFATIATADTHDRGAIARAAVLLAAALNELG